MYSRMADLYALTPAQSYDQLDFIPEFVDPTTDDYEMGYYSHESQYDDPNYPNAVYGDGRATADGRTYVRAPCDMNPITPRYPPQQCGRTTAAKKLVDAEQDSKIQFLDMVVDRYLLAFLVIILLVVGNFVLTCAVAIRMRAPRPMGFM